MKIFRKLDGIIKSIEEKKQAIEDFLGDIGHSVQGVIDVLNAVGDIVMEIRRFAMIVGDLIYSDLFDGVEFQNFYDFMAG